MRTPHVLQHDAMQCGVTSLAIVCRCYGKKYSLTQLSELCHATARGVSMKAIADAAQTLGLRPQGAKIDMDTLTHAPLPLILHWDQDHFVVLCRAYPTRKGARYVISDPARGVVKMSRREVEQHWCAQDPHQGETPMGIVLTFSPTQEFMDSEPEQCDGKREPLRFLWRYFRQYRSHFLQIVLGLLLACVLQLALPFLTQAIVDVGIKKEDLGIIWLILLGEFMILAGRTATDFIRRWLLLHISMRINVSLVSDFIAKLMRLPMSFFDTKLTGDLLQRMGDHGRIQSFLTTQVLTALFATLSLLVFGTVLFIYDKLVFAAFLAGSLLYAAWSLSFLKRRRLLDYEMFGQQAKNQNVTYQLVTSMPEIKVQGCQRRRRWEWEDVQADVFATQLKSQKLQQSQEAGSIFINEVKNVVITVLAATAVIDGRMTLGAMLATQYIVGQLNSPVGQMISLLYSAQDVTIALERINEVHLQKDEQDSSQPLLTPPSAPVAMSLHGVTFRYDPHDPRTALDGVSLEIPAGKTTAIVGASGSGKTTLVKLLLGYFPPTCGSVMVNSQPLACHSLEGWRSICGAVLQDGALFTESIARNIAVDDGEIDPARLLEAARAARLDQYVGELPLGYDTIIGRDGEGLSEGQKQRVLIARAFYKNPSVLILDEATNSLDAENERAIVENLARFSQGKTTVVVAHRLSTVCNADQIIVLDQGRVAEIGTHAQLVARRGAYYNLVKNQLELGT